ncbi:MAG: APC family permease [Leptolyngbya sp. Prado105]|jgi:amino acid transporter|nr:APC family permease [Leptolyngbya sp. Prado105]
MTTHEDSTSLKRVFGLPALVIYGVGDILGAGIYAVIGDITKPSASLVWVSFIVAMVVAAFTALSYAELGGRLPRCGGVAHFVHQAFRTEWLSVLVGWLMFCTCLVSMATISKAFAGYLMASLPGLPEWFLIISLFAALGYVNFRGMKESSLLNLICTVVEVSGLLIVILVAGSFLFGGAAAAAAPVTFTEPALGWTGIINGASIAFYAFIGFEDIVNVAEEVKDPERNVPRGIVLSLAIAGVIYIAVSWLAVQVLNPAELSASNAPLLSVVSRAQPNFPKLIFTLIPIFAVMNTALLNFVTASRLVFGMAREGLIPAWAGKLHPERATPYRAILVILAIVTVIALAGTRELLAGTTATLILIMFVLTNLSLLVIKQREPIISGFRVPIAVPVIAMLLNLVLIVYAQQKSHFFALGFMGIGILLILLQNAVRKRQLPSI